MSDNVTLFEKNQDNTIFRLAIYGTNDNARELYTEFDSNICNVQMFDDINDLVKFQPHNVFMTAEDSNTAAHTTLQELSVALTLFRKISNWELRVLLEDYKHRRSYEKVVVVGKVGPTTIWGGAGVGIDNLLGVYDQFAKHVVPVETVAHEDVNLIVDKYEELRQYVKQWKNSIKDHCVEHKRSTNKLLRVASAVAFFDEV